MQGSHPSRQALQDQVKSLFKTKLPHCSNTEELKANCIDLKEGGLTKEQNQKALQSTVTSSPSKKFVIAKKSINFI